MSTKTRPPMAAIQTPKAPKTPGRKNASRQAVLDNFDLEGEFLCLLRLLWCTLSIVRWLFSILTGWEGFILLTVPSWPIRSVPLPRRSRCRDLLFATGIPKTYFLLPISPPHRPIPPYPH